MLFRNCPICGSKKRKLLYLQKYTSHFNHRIVECINCNFLFVDNIPSKKYYDEYYKNQSKYEGTREHESHEEQLIKEIVCFTKNNITKTSNILDIGSSIGYLLSVLKQQGYKKLLGIEPASKCKKIAREKYGIKIKTSDLDGFKSFKKYDFVILSQVLEHVVDIKGTILKIADLLKDDGYLYIGVPNTLVFPSKITEPFGEFSTEHINFFTDSSLYFLMRGFTNISMKTENNCLHSIWKKGDSGVKSILKYINLSNDKLVMVKKKIDSLPDKIIVWGAGALSQRLLSTTKIKKKILFFVDSNEKLQGSKLGGLQIFSPNILLEKNCEIPILISSYNFSKEIIKNIKEKGYKNNIIVF